MPLSPHSSAALPLAPLLPARLPPEAGPGRVLTGLGRRLDAGVLRAMQIVVERALIPDPSRLASLRASARALSSDDLLGDPRRFFAFAEPSPREPRVTRRAGRRGAGVVVDQCRIETDYRPYLPLAAGASRTAAASPIHVELWRRRDGPPRGTVVLLHGFTMGRPRIDAAVLMARPWFEQGLDVALLTLPDHGARTPPGARFSGERFAVPDVGGLGEAVRQAVYEIRRVVDWRRAETRAPVGLLGLSLGGYLAALMAGLYDDLDFVIPMAPPACIGDLAWGFLERSAQHRQGGPATLSRDELRQAFRVHSPLAHPLRTARERVLIVAGRGDRIVPPEHPAALWRHWHQPEIHWFSGSHLAPFGRRRIVRRVSRHLRMLGIL